MSHRSPAPLSAASADVSVLDDPLNLDDDHDQIPHSSPAQNERLREPEPAHVRLWRLFRTRLRYYVPIIGWLPHYDAEANLQSDIIAGITTACLVIPQSISYSQILVNIPAIYGLKSAMVMCVVYALLGTSRQLAAGPEALVSILVGSSVREYVHWRDTSGSAIIQSAQSINATFITLDNATYPFPRDPIFNVPPVSLMCLMVGIFTFMLGVLRLGFLDSVLSRALLRGFVLAVACVVMIDMAPTVMGIIPHASQCISSNQLSSPPSADPNNSGPIPIGEDAAPFQKLVLILFNMKYTHALSFAISSISIGFLLLAQYLKKRYKSIKWAQMVPEILVVVSATILMAWLWRWDCMGVDIIGNVGSTAYSLAESTPSAVGSATYGGYPSTTPPDIITIPRSVISQIRFFLVPAIMISVIGFVESVVISKTYATKYGYGVSPNRDLVAFGVGNMVTGMFVGGVPGFGSLGRSAVNDGAGASTQVSGFITGLCVWCTSVWLLPLFTFMPKCVCAAVVIVAAIKLVELEDLYFMVRVRAWSDLGLLLVTFMTTLGVGIEVGTVLSVGVSLLMVMKHTTRTRVSVMGETLVVDTVTGKVKTKYRCIHEHGNHDGNGHTIERFQGGLVVRIEESLFFGNVGQLKDRLKRIEAYGELGVHPSEEPRRNQRIRQSLVYDGQVREGANHGSGGTPIVVQDVDHNQDDEITPLMPQQSDPETIRSVIIDMSSVTSIDATATQTLLELVLDYQSRDIVVCFVKVREGCMDMMKRSGVYGGVVGQQWWFGKVRDAVGRMRQMGRLAESRMAQRVHNVVSGSEEDASVRHENAAIVGNGLGVMPPFRVGPVKMFSRPGRERADHEDEQDDATDEHAPHDDRDDDVIHVFSDSEYDGGADAANRHHDFHDGSPGRL